MWAGRDFYFGAGDRSAERRGGWVPPRAPRVPVTFPRPFPGGASRAGRGEVGGAGGQAVTSSPPPGGSALSLSRAAGWGGDSGRRSQIRTEGRRRREAVPPPAPLSAAGPKQGVRPRCPALRAAPPVALREEAVSVRGAFGLFSSELGTRRSCSHVFRRPALLSVCPPTASCVLRPGLPGPRVLRGAMRSAAGPGRTGQCARRAPSGVGP